MPSLPPARNLADHAKPARSGGAPSTIQVADPPVWSARARALCWLNTSSWPAALCGLPVVLLAVSIAWLRFLPNARGWLGPDYSMWLPLLLSGDDWIKTNGVFSVAWFSPAQCGGIPLHADPQGAALSLPQFLSLVLPPAAMLRTSFLLYASAGYLGAFWLAKQGFGTSRRAALLAGAAFAANSFLGGRLAVGHLSFAPFMLLPLAALCVIKGAGSPQEARNAWTDDIWRSAALGIIIAIALESGMLVLLPPFVWSLLAIVALHAFARGATWRPALRRLAGGLAWGAALAAAKVSMVLALLSHFPRDGYTLPGYISLAESAFMVIRALFLGPFADMTSRLANASVLMERPEFEYSVGLAPLVLVSWAALLWRRHGTALGGRRRLALDALILLLLAPIALNTYGAGWTAFLKTLPVLRNSSSLLRWVAADMLPAILAAALALDYLCADWPRTRRSWLAAGALALTLPALAWPGRSFYGPDGAGRYDPTAITAGWRTLRTTGPAPITRIGVRDPSRESLDRWILQRQDSMVSGASPLFCYDALFGYRLEAFPRGALHEGSVFDRNGDSLNLKNPACYVFPAANACRPGDGFAATAIDQAARFVAYKDFNWRKPAWARVADWVGWITWPVTLLLLVWVPLSRRMARRRA